MATWCRRLALQKKQIHDLSCQDWTWRSGHKIINILILAWKHLYGELYLLLSISAISYSSSHFPYCFWPLMSQAVHARLAGSIHVLCFFSKPTFLTFSVSCKISCPFCAKKFVLIYYQLKNYKSECHSYVVLTRFAGLASWSGREIPEWWKVRLRLSLTRVLPGQMLSSRNLFPSPCAVRPSIWPWTCQASYVLGKLFVKGNTCLCPTFILLLTC